VDGNFVAAKYSKLKQFRSTEQLVMGNSSIKKAHMIMVLRLIIGAVFLVETMGCAVLGQGGKGAISVIYYAPAWGPNTNDEEVVYFLKQVTFQSAATEQSRIYFCSIKPDGTERREIAWLWKDKPDQFLEPFATAAHMEINPVTRRAALGIELGERGGIFVFKLDGSDFQSVWPKEWNEDRPTKAGYPTWSPDGEWLAFHEYRFEKGFNHYRIAKMRPDASDYTPLTERNATNYQPAWSPNGDLIAYVSHKEVHLYLMKPDGSAKRDTKVWGRYPRWSPDGKFILHSGLSLVDAQAAKQIKVWRGAWIYPRWGTTGFLSVGPSDISIADLEGKQSKQLLGNVSRRADAGSIERKEFRW